MPDLVVGTALALGSSVLFGVLLLMLMAEHVDALGPLVLTGVVAVSGAVLLFVVWGLTVRKYGIPWMAVGLRRPIHARLYWVAPIVLLGSLAFTGLYTFVVSTLGYDLLIPEPLPDELFGEGLYRAVATLAVVSWIPFVEEVFFRGFLFGGLSARYGVPVGAVGSSTLFALAHVSVGAMLPILVTGMLFAWAYHRTRSIWIPVSAHAGQNLLAVLSIGPV